MKAWLALVPIIASACETPSFPQEFDGVRALAYVETQLAFGPRVPGTPGHTATGDWLIERMLEMADTAIVQSFIHVTEDGDTLPMRNVLGRFRPDLERRILYLAHWDTRPTADQSRNLAEQRQPVPGANDGASGVAILLGVADALAAAPPEVGVDLLFVDGEDYGDFSRNTDVFIGSRYYAEHPLPGRLPAFAIVFDMVGDADLGFYKEGNSVLAAPDIVDFVWDVAARQGYGRYFNDNVRHTISDDHVSLHRIGIKAIDIIDFDHRGLWHTVDDDLDEISAESLQIVGDVAMAVLRS